MFIELVDSLRCLAAHEDTWLVASVTRMEGRHIIEGTLGCPLCRREYSVRDGVAWFTTSPPDPTLGSLTRSTPPAEDERVSRAAALLGLADGGGSIVLGGSWGDCADGLAELGPAHVVVLNRSAASMSPQQVSSIVVDDRLPFAAGAVSGVALDREMSTPTLVGSAAVVLRSRGRLIAPATVPMPDGVTELARDSVDWVAERAVVASPPVMLRSARR